MTDKTNAELLNQAVELLLAVDNTGLLLRHNMPLDAKVADFLRRADKVLHFLNTKPEDAALSRPPEGQPAGEPVGWIQEHRTGSLSFTKGGIDPRTVHDNGLPTYPVFRHALPEGVVPVPLREFSIWADMLVVNGGKLNHEIRAMLAAAKEE